MSTRRALTFAGARALWAPRGRVNRMLGALLAGGVACGHAAPMPGSRTGPLATEAAKEAKPEQPSHVHGQASLVPLFDDLGTWSHPVRAGALAQRYFDQGLRLMYGFNHEEAIRSFERAAALDPRCAMCLWGIAVSLGPNINLPTDPDREKLAWDTVQKAQALAREPVEKDYLAAVAKRYANPPGPDRAAKDRAYADAMRALSRNHPDDDDAAVLFAESLMDLRPWNLWSKDGEPRPGTEEILATLERVLARRPEHPGANHFYIHATEASPHPEKALAAAGRLPSLSPGAGHLVHMPAHTYIRTGRYEEAAEANRRAIAVDKTYLARTNAQGFYAMMYVAHNFHFLWAAAAQEGRSAESIQAAREMAAHFPPEMVRGMEAQMAGVDYFLAPPYFALVRFGRWQDILREPEPPADFKYLTGVWRFARAMAFAATGDADRSRREHQQLEAFVAALPPDAILGPLNTARSVFAVADKALLGERAARAGRTDEAVKLLREAVVAEDALGYDEPPPWPLPPRHALGAVLLAAGRAREAEAVYLEDLRRNPENGWALYGLAQSLGKLGSKEADGAQKRFERAWAHADVRLTSSRF
jgi:tetratricopeptide (TPR) repeat protein